MNYVIIFEAHNGEQSHFIIHFFIHWITYKRTCSFLWITCRLH